MAAAAKNVQISSSIAPFSDANNFGDKYHHKEVKANYFKIFASYVQNGSGAFRFFQAIKNGCKWPILYAQELRLSSDVASRLFKTHNFFRGSARGLILTKIPYTVVGLNSSYQEYINADEKTCIRKRDKFAYKTVSLIADCSTMLQLGEMIGIYALGSVIGPSANFAGSLFLLFQHMFCLKMEGEDFIDHKIIQTEEKANIKDSKRLTTLFHEIRNLDLLKITKSIVSIALGIFMVAEFAFSMSMLSPTALLLLSTASTVLAIWTHFYKESMTYPYKC